MDSSSEEEWASHQKTPGGTISRRESGRSHLHDMSSDEELYMFKANLNEQNCFEPRERLNDSSPMPPMPPLEDSYPLGIPFCVQCVPVGIPLCKPPPPLPPPDFSWESEVDSISDFDSLSFFDDGCTFVKSYGPPELFNIDEPFFLPCFQVPL